PRCWNRAVMWRSSTWTPTTAPFTTTIRISKAITASTMTSSENDWKRPGSTAWSSHPAAKWSRTTRYSRCFWRPPCAVHRVAHMTSDPNEKPEQSGDNNRIGVGVGVGLALGAAIGVAMDNIGMGVGVGLAIGAAIGASG